MFDPFGADFYLPDNEQYLKRAIKIARTALKETGGPTIGQEVMIDDSGKRYRIVSMDEEIAKLEALSGITAHGLMDIIEANIDQLFLPSALTEAISDLRKADRWRADRN